MKKRVFFLAASLAMMFIILLGFSRTFLLRPLFRDTELPWHLIIHGIFMLGWFTGLIYQSFLIYKKRVINHERSGRYLFVLSVFVILSTLNIIREMGLSFYDGTRSVEEVSPLIVGNMYLIITSTIYLLVAYFFRYKFNIHKRAIYLASFTMLGPAYDRFGRLFDIPFQISFFVFPVLIVGALIAYDIATRKRPHYLSIIGLLWSFATVPIVLGLAGSGIVGSILEMLR